MPKKTILAITAAAVLTAGPGLASPAEAAGAGLPAVPCANPAVCSPPLKWHSRPYDVAFTGTSKALRTCITMVAAGNIRFYSRPVIVNGVPEEILVKKVVLSDPRIFITSKTNCHRSGVPVNLTKATLEQVWYNHGCSNSYQFSVGSGWFAGVGVTRTCGNVQRAGRRTTYNAKSSTYYQFNHGYPATLSPREGILIDFKKGKICERLDLKTTVYQKMVSDSFGHSFNPCVLGH